MDPMTMQLLFSGLNYASQQQTNQQNVQQNERNNQMQVFLQNQQNQFNARMWERNNQYNSPTMQMERLRKAGLNPGLAYGGNVANVSQGAVQQQSKAQTNPSIRQAPQFDNQVANVLLQQRQLDQQEAVNQSIIKANEAQARKTNADALSQETKQPYLSKSIELEIESLQQNINLAKSNIQNLDSKTISQQLDNSLNLQTLDTKVNQIKAEYKLTTNQIEQVKANVILLRTSIVTEALQQKLIDAKTFTERQNYIKLIQDTKQSSERHIKALRLDEAQIKKAYSDSDYIMENTNKLKFENYNKLDSDGSGLTNFGATLKLLDALPVPFTK